MPRLYDISPTVSPRIAVWPGDVPFERKVALDMKLGAHLTLSSIETTLHLGAHADAPNHYEREGQSIGERDLGYYYGECQVLAVSVGRGERIGPGHLRAAITAERVLFRTGTFPDPEDWNTDFAAFSPELIDLLHHESVVLVGIDTPSVDLQDDKALLSHTRIASYDMAVLEGLVLDHVPPGRYTLSAFPLKLEGADASPVRAVLIDDYARRYRD